MFELVVILVLIAFDLRVFNDGAQSLCKGKLLVSSDVLGVFYFLALQCRSV